MRRVALVAAIAAAACGRIGFDDVARDGPPGDGPPGSGLGTFGGAGADAGYALAPFSDGGVAVLAWLASATPIGGLPTTNVGNVDLALFRLGPDGTVRWVHSYGSTMREIPHDVAVAPDGTIYVVGHTHGAIDLGGGVEPIAGDDDGFLASYTADGAYRWSRLIGGTVTGGPYGDDNVWGVAADAGGVYITGYVRGDVDFGGTVLTPTGGDFDAYLASYDAAGGLRWAKRWGDTRYNQGYQLAVAPNGDVIVTGFYEGTPDLGGGPPTAYRGVQDTFIVVRDRDGAFQWQTDFGGPGFDWLYGVDTDAAGNIYASGLFETSTDLAGGIPSAGMRDGLVASWTGDGGFRWARTTGGAGCDGFRQLAVIEDAVIAVGGFSGTVDFGPPTGAVTATGVADGLVRGYATDGTPRFSAITTGADDDFLLGIAGAAKTSAFVAGITAGTSGDWCNGAESVESDGTLARLVIP